MEASAQCITTLQPQKPPGKKKGARLRPASVLPEPRIAALGLNDNWPKSRGAEPGSVDVIDMFCGCGGMSVGFCSLNGAAPSYRLVGAVDIDKVAVKTYESNLGIKPSTRSVAELARSPELLDATISEMRGGPPNPLVLIGCSPCQGFSSLRNEDGTTDHRNSLFADFAEIALRLRPEVIVVENVPEVLTDRYWPIVAHVRNLLESSGYYVNIGVHNMAEFGVPQERFRTLMLAMTKPFSAPRGFLERSGFKTVREAIGHLPQIAAGQRDPSDPMHYTAGHRESTIATIRAVPKNGGSRPENVGPDCLRRAKARNGRAVFKDVYGRLFWDKPAITVTAYARNPASGRYVHPEQDRGLSVREAALLQSFPREYEFSGSLDERFRQIGNAVPPAFASYLAAHILQQLSGDFRAGEFQRGMISSVGPSFSRLIPSLKAGHRSSDFTRGAATPLQYDLL